MNHHRAPPRETQGVTPSTIHVTPLWAASLYLDQGIFDPIA
ncbi:hypothetical protein ABTK37_19340 [Acinetobacter baumannii]